MNLTHRKWLSWSFIAISALFITGAVFGASTNAFAKVGPSMEDADEALTPGSSRPWIKWFNLDVKASTRLVIPANATEAERQTILRERLDDKAVAIKFKWRGSRSAVGYQVQKSVRKAGFLSEPLSTEATSTQWGAWSDVQSNNSRKNGTVTDTYSFDTWGKGLRWRIRVKDADDRWSQWGYVYVTYGFKWMGSENHGVIASYLFVN